VATDTDEDPLAAGVADPTKVARSAWPHASSMAALMLTTEALITELPAKNEKTPTTHPGGGDDEACEGAASGVPIAADTDVKISVVARTWHLLRGSAGSPGSPDVPAV
jgi:hypothetical protein